MCVVIIKSLLYMYTKDLVNLVTCGPRILSRLQISLLQIFFTNPLAVMFYD